MTIGSAAKTSPAQLAKDSVEHQSLLKTANDQPKLALQLIASLPVVTGNVGSNINIFV